MSRRVRTPEQKGIRRITLADGAWAPLKGGEDPGTPIADGLYCLAHAVWHPISQYYPDREKATGYGSTCKEDQKARFVPRSEPVERRSKYE